MITLKDLSIGYIAKNNRKVVAENITADILPGELTCLIGPNGVGKSTLLRTLSAFQPALGGEIFINDQPISGLTDRELSKLIGVVLTSKPDVQNMTVFELIALGRSPYTGFWGTLHEEDKAIVEESIRMVGIGSLRDHMVQTLSDGERQKMMIAKALAQQTPVIYLDEPTAAPSAEPRHTEDHFPLHPRHGTGPSDSRQALAHAARQTRSHRHTAPTGRRRKSRRFPQQQGNALRFRHHVNQGDRFEH